MYDSGKIIPGLLIFILMITLPIWYNNLIGDVGAMQPVSNNEIPEATFQGLTFPNEAKHALSTPEMRSTHMNMLQDIHAVAMKQGYTPEKDGKKESMKCLLCHGTKEGFCDSCHVHAGVTIPDCWTCHKK